MSEMSPRRFSQYELTLEEMLADPIVRLLMQRDGVNDEDIRTLMAHQVATLDRR
ncbi:MAG: hypothetical protein AAGC58_06125 [Asticcacaulis sp.]